MEASKDSMASCMAEWHCEDGYSAIEQPGPWFHCSCALQQLLPLLDMDMDRHVAGMPAVLVSSLVSSQ